MRKTFLMIGVGLILSQASTVSSRAANVDRVALHGHVPAIVSQLQAKGSLSPGTNLCLSIGLPLRNHEALTNLLGQIYDPSSPNYHHFLTPDEFTARFGPTVGDYKMVINFARVNGLTVVGEHSNRMLLDVTGKASDIERAFNINLRVYHHPTENRDFFAPDVEPSVPAGLPVLDVGGLSNLRRPRSHYKLKPVVKSAQSTGSPMSSSPGATTGSGPFGNYIGDDFRNAYVPGTPLNGSGQTIALVQFDGYLSNDIVAYETLAGRTNVPLQNVLLDGFNGLPTGNGGEVEVSLDIEMVISMAPALSKVVVYEGDPYNFHPNDVLNQIAIDDSARQVSCSWGWTGGPTATTDQIFEQMALQGQTFFVASGDGDAYPAGTVDNPFNFGTPADNPYVTSVGGTTLTMLGAGVSYSSETVWNWGIRYGDDGVGSSGGFSSYYSIPSWQTNINMTARGGSTTFRNFPDVALTADDVLVIADGGLEYIGVGGTSCASPLWAGFMALVNQQATNNNHAAIGFLNSAIYNIAKSVNYTNCFHDTTVGNDIWSGSPTLFYATNNYDLCTGLGTPNGTNLINALTLAGVTNTITHITAPPPPYGTTLSAMNGGNPNGTWHLFVLDNAQYNTGIISNGWILTLTTANPLVPTADLGLSMTASASTVAVSNYLTYTLAVTNYGPSTSSNVLVSDTLPLSMRYVSSSLPNSVSQNGQLLNWNAGTLVTNAGSQLLVTVLPTVTGTNIINYATASSITTPDANPADDDVLVSVSVTSPNAPGLAGSFPAGGGGVFKLAVTGDTSTIIQASTNLVKWINVYTNMPPFTYTNFDSTNYQMRFYRAVTGP